MIFYNKTKENEAERFFLWNQFEEYYPDLYEEIAPYDDSRLCKTTKAIAGSDYDLAGCESAIYGLMQHGITRIIGIYRSLSCRVYNYIIRQPYRTNPLVIKTYMDANGLSDIGTLDVFTMALSRGAVPLSLRRVRTD